MNVSVPMFILLTSTVSFISINGVNGSPNFDIEKASHSAADLETTIELTIAVTLKFLTFALPPWNRNLNAYAWLTRAICITYTRPVNGEAWTEYHSTEIISRTRNPTFTSKVRIPYLLKDKLELKFEVYNEVGDTSDYGPMSDLVSMGYAMCKVADLVSARRLTIPMRYGNGKDTVSSRVRLGYVVVYAEKLSNKYNKVTLKLESENIDKKGVCGGPKHYIEIHKRFMVEKEASTSQDDYVIVYRTKKKKENREKKWEPISIPFSTLCNDDRTRELKFVCRDQKHLIGEFRTTVKEMQEYKTDFHLSTEKNNTAGRISISDIIIDLVPSFADFMLAGLQIHLTIAVDFTRRSGLFENPKSFHYRGGGENKCEKAIRLVVNAFEDYVWNNKYDIRGFGARRAYDMSTTLEYFPLNEVMDGVDGIEGAIQAYHNALGDESLQIGPITNLAPTILKFGHRAAVNTPSSNSYCVLVVLAMGVIDVDARTWAAMKEVRAGKASSIIFVSIGDTDLTEVKKLQKAAANTSLRNYFHFVYVSESDLQDGDDSSAYHSTELLAKLPEQAVLYMNSKGLKPKNLQ